MNMLPDEPLLAHFTLTENPTRAFILRLAITIMVLVVALRIAG